SCRIIKWDQVSIPLTEDGSKVAQFKQISHEYTVKRGIVDIFRKEEERLLQKRFLRKVEDFFYEDSPISPSRTATSMKGRDWNVTGNIVGDVFRAANTLAESLHDHDMVLQVSPEVYPMLLRSRG
ncbi:hypothetical protein B2A_14488, partial [mine drainage metagenome]